MQRWCLVSVLALLVLAPLDALSADLVTGNAWSEGVTGRPAVRHKGWFEEMIFLSPKGSGGMGSADQTGEFGIGNRGRFNIINPSGSFAAGTYGLCVFGYEDIPGFDYVTDVSVAGGTGTTVRDIPVRCDYSVQFDDLYTEWEDEPWTWGNSFYQTFTARSRHVTRVATRMVKKNSGVINLSFQIVKTNSGPPSSWTGVTPVRTRKIKDLEPVSNFILWSPFLSRESELIPGEEYAMHVWCPDGTGSEEQFGIYRRVDNNDGYADGMLYNSDTPYPNFDLYGYVTGGGDNNTVINYAPIDSFETKTLLGFGNVFGQTFKATGEGLAAVEAAIATGSDSLVQISWQLYDGVGGNPVGPAKLGWTSKVHAYLQKGGAFWHPGEVDLVPGHTYYIEGNSPQGCNLYNMEDGYPDGQCYLDRVAQSGRDIIMSIAEWEFIASAGTPTPTATPVPGGNLIPNGDLNQGTTGTDGNVPDGWTKWTGSGTPVWWYGPDYGMDGTNGARLIGGSINGRTFDAGLYQRITGLTPGHRYDLNGYGLVNPAGDTGYRGWIGIDLTGQTTSGLLQTVNYWEIPSTGQYEQIGAKSIIATGNTATIFLRAANTRADMVFYVDFDNISLIDRGATVTPTPTPTLTPTLTPTPEATGGVGWRAY